MNMSKKFEMLAKEVRECKRCSECPLNVNQNCGFNFIDCCTYCTAEDIEFFYENSKKLIQTLENIEEPILDKVEKEYLRNVLAPWLKRDDTHIYIEKWKSIIEEKWWLEIEIKVPFKEPEIFSLPVFYSKKMYAGMKENVYYSAEELKLR